MSETSKEASAGAFTVRTNPQFKSPAQTERKLHCDCCSRKLKETSKGNDRRARKARGKYYIKGGYKYAFRNGIHDSSGRSAGEPRGGLQGVGRSRCKHCRFSVEPGDARKEFGSYGD